MTVASTPAGGKSIHVQFDDNRLLSALFGEHDQHLARIEQRLGVSVISRGNRIAIRGTASSARAARAVLTALYDRLRRGLEVDMG